MKHRLAPEDRRARLRFAIGRELRYRVTNEGRDIAMGTGSTIDISSRGVSFATRERLSAGALVELSISWPAELDGRLPLRLVAYGRIMRSDEGIAVSTIERYEFRTQPRAAPAMASLGDMRLRRWVDENARMEARRIEGL